MCRSTDRPTYDEACALAATDQGLDPLLAALESAKIVHALEQTGGMCMVVTAPGTLDGDTGTHTITATEDPDGPEWLVAFHPGNTWNTGEYDDYPDEATLTTAVLVEVIRTSQTRTA